MPRSRSRSRDRGERRRSRSRSRDRERRREKYRSSRRSRSRSPRHRDRSPRRRDRDEDRRPAREPVPAPAAAGSDDDMVLEQPGENAPKPITLEDLATEEDDEQKMMELMGFGKFDTTKGKKVAGNDHYSVHIVRKRRYRQYMNRRGGFNRPLDFIA